MGKRYSWYISYHYLTLSGKNGFGCTCVTAPNKMRNADDITEMAEFIKDSHVAIEKVVILFWKRLQKEEEQ